MRMRETLERRRPPSFREPNQVPGPVRSEEPGAAGVLEANLAAKEAMCNTSASSKESRLALFTLPGAAHVFDPRVHVRVGWGTRCLPCRKRGTGRPPSSRCS
jgi:hypothetical protein